MRPTRHTTTALKSWPPRPAPGPSAPPLSTPSDATNPGSPANCSSIRTNSDLTDTPHDDRIEVMAAQTRAWTERATTFDTLGRYESRLSRQLLKYQDEFRSDRHATRRPH